MSIHNLDEILSIVDNKEYNELHFIREDFKKKISKKNDIVQKGGGSQKKILNV